MRIVTHRSHEHVPSIVAIAKRASTVWDKHGRQARCCCCCCCPHLPFSTSNPVRSLMLLPRNACRSLANVFSAVRAGHEKRTGDNPTSGRQKQRLSQPA